MRSLIVLCALVAQNAYAQDRPTMKEYKNEQKDNAADEKAAMDKQAKMAAVDKVVSMLKDLQMQVLAEGEQEAATYNKFACFCKTTQKEKSEAISTGKDDKEALSAQITKLSDIRDGLDKKMAEHTENIKKAEAAVKKATAESDKAHAEYATNEADLKAALYALQEAIKVLKSSKTPSLIQLQSVAKTVQKAALMADALGLGGDEVQKAATFLLQQGDVPVEMEDYKFHSNSIIETLEKLLGNFRKTKADVDADEVKRVQEYDLFIQDRTDYIKAQNKELAEAKATRAQTIADIGTASQELTTVSATLLDDMQYLDELNTVCSDKAKTWDQRTKLRANELTAITQATGIIKSTVSDKTQASTVRLAQRSATLHLADAVANSDYAMESIEAAAEDEEAQSPLGFLQRRSVQKHSSNPDEARQLILSLLRGKGQELKSTLLTSLASQIAKDPFAKVKQLIQELIERLLTESANEATQKGWCDKAIADAKQKRQYAADEVEDLNARMAKLEALSDKLGEELDVLSKEIKELEDNRAEAQKNRDEEKEENANTVKEGDLGKEAVEQAIDILDKFYKTSAKAEVDLSLAQGPADDAPDAGFANGEAYKGAQAEAGGIIGMLEVIQSDFERTITETKKAEASAEQEHLEFMTETGKSLAEKNVATKEKTKLKNETDQNLSDTSDSLDSQMVFLTTSIKELIELKATCIDTGMSYADRVARREEEMEALKKALCILTAFQEYGPDGAAEGC
jgi:hypothetical protein